MACMCPAACRSGDGACLPCLAGCTHTLARLPLGMLAVGTAARASCQTTVQAVKPLVCATVPCTSTGRQSRASWSTVEWSNRLNQV